MQQLGRLGVWTFLDLMQAEEAATFVRKVEALGYSMLWLPEAIGRDPFTLLGFLAARTERLGFATGIANIYARDPMTMRAIQQTMAELSGGRFVLGLGVSHAHLVSAVRGHEYRKPVTAMREYLDRHARRPLSRRHAGRRGAGNAGGAAAGNAARGARSGARCPPVSDDARAHDAGPRDPRPGPLAGARADGDARDRRHDRPRHGAQHHGDLPRACQTTRTT